MSTAAEILMSALLLAGGFFALVGSIGLVKLNDLYLRLHGPTKASTLGVGGILVASMLYHSVWGAGLSLRELLITLFLFITAPVSAMMIMRAQLSQIGDRRPQDP
jgi:multicomponent K+:H+ antiporter subunit G